MGKVCPHLIGSQPPLAPAARHGHVIHLIQPARFRPRRGVLAGGGVPPSHYPPLKDTDKKTKTHIEGVRRGGSRGHGAGCQGGRPPPPPPPLRHHSGFYGMRAFLILCAASACHVSPRLGSPRTPLRGAPLALRYPPCRGNPSGQPHKKLAPGPWGAACAGGGPPAPSGALRLQRMAQDRLASLEGGAPDFYFHGITPPARSFSLPGPPLCAQKTRPPPP